MPKKVIKDEAVLKADNAGQSLKEAKPKGFFNDLAIIAFILAFTQPLAGFVIGIISLCRIRKTKERGKWLGIAAIVIASLIILFAFSVALLGLPYPDWMA